MQNIHTPIKSPLAITLNEQQRQADRLLTQQCLVRRFSYNHKEDYSKLLELRNDIFKALSTLETNTISDFCGVSTAFLTGKFLSLFESQAGKYLIQKKE